MATPMEAIDLTPEWSGLFRYAVAVIKAELPKEKGQEFVIEMLEFGGRLYREMEIRDQDGKGGETK